MGTTIDVNQPPLDLTSPTMDSNDALKRILAFCTKLNAMEANVATMAAALAILQADTYRDVAVGGSITPYNGSFAAVGPHLLITPAADRRVCIWWWMWNTSQANLATVDLGFRWGIAGANFLDWNGVGGNVAVGSNLRAGKMKIRGPVGESLYLDQSATQRVSLNIFYEEEP